MVRPKLDRWWTDFARGLFENEPRLNDRQVAERCEQMMAKTERLNPPAQRTITKWRHQWRTATVEQRMAYRRFFWPESMVQGLLPWEAGQVTLEALRRGFEHDWFRPTVATMRWLWRVTLAAPDASLDDRMQEAQYLSASEVIGNLSTEGAYSPGVRGTEAFLAAAPWRSQESRALYTRLRDRHKIPDLDSVRGLGGGHYIFDRPDVDRGTLNQAAGEYWGIPGVAEAWDEGRVPSGKLQTDRDDQERSDG